ncbi:MAG: type II toxin-antitoxin system RelE/ParE family toxin [Gammaproteobacteria bacterium]
MSVFWLPEALSDIERLYDFLLAKDPRAAERAIRTVDDSVDRLVDFPEIGRPMDDETGRRELIAPFGAGGYVVRYLIYRDTAFIIRVWHSREIRT